MKFLRNFRPYVSINEGGRFFVLVFWFNRERSAHPHFFYIYLLGWRWHKEWRKTKEIPTCR